MKKTTFLRALANRFGKLKLPSYRIAYPLSMLLLLLLPMAAFSGCEKKEEPFPIIVEDTSEEHEETRNIEDDNLNTVAQPDTPSSDAVNNPLSESASDMNEAALTEEVNADTVLTFINPEGTTLQDRINTPAGFNRITSKEGELTYFLRNLPLKPDQSEVLLYNGQAKSNQSAHAAVFDLEIGEKDLQQCADSVIRIYAEYYWSQGSYDKIAFHLTNGFLMEYTKWRDGNRLVVDGNDVRWSKTEAYDDSYQCFRKYLDMVFVYAGTLSLTSESKRIALEELKPGDMFLKGGSPGHCVLVVDIAEDSEGNRCFLLAQGYMPAQEFHIIKNPLHSDDPWYYFSEISYPLDTPAWRFDEGSLVRWGDFPLEGFQAADTLSTQSFRLINGTVPVMSERLVTGKDVSQVTLLAVGDNLIHIEVVESGQQADGSLNYDHLYENIKDRIAAADIAIINQETILGGSELKYSGYPNFNSPTEIGDALVKAGFDVVTHATNHTMDKGYEGLKNTFEFWKKYPQIVVLGINETKEDRDTITVIEKNGIKLAFLNYTYGLNGHQLPSDKQFLVNMLDKKKILEDIKKAEELADFTIVLPHWGTEYKYEPSKDQKFYTNLFYEAGVDLVIGTHPHVLEPVEWIGKEGKHRMLVYYSLGNFISYQKEAPRMLGGIASVTITKSSGNTFISSAGITPIITHFEHGPADYNYGIYTLEKYSESLAKLHGVSDLANNGPFTYEGTLDLAKQVLGEWMR